MYHPSLDLFREQCRQGNLIPIYREILADMETPVSAFLKIDDGRYSFLLESVEGGENWARYSFLGSGPTEIFRCKGRCVEIIGAGGVQTIETDDPLTPLRSMMKGYRPVVSEGLPRFFGGAVGYVGYDMVRFFERLPEKAAGDLDLYDAVLMFTDSLLVFDNVRKTIKVVVNVHLRDDGSPEAAYQDAVDKIEGIIARLRKPLVRDDTASSPLEIGPVHYDLKPDEYRGMVVRAKEYVIAGDIIQAVLSQRFRMESDVKPFDVYRALRVINPSPYMFFQRLGDCVLFGSSPEVLVRLEEGKLETRPIAGTRPRGDTEEEDRRLEQELLADPKERAEHIMLVDLGRNDLGRVSVTGSVGVSELMAIERYSHVMHIVSHVHSRLKPELDCFDALRAAFPAGTLSGAPKIRAMEIIDELEPMRRGPYGGSIGYVSYSGNMDMGITIRSMVVKDGTIYFQAGAGIVADSDPEKERQECLSKARALVRAIEMASRGL